MWPQLLNYMANFFLAAPLYSLFGSFVCFWNYRQISLTPGEDKFIISKNFHPFILPWQRYFIEEGKFQNTKRFWIFLKQVASLVVVSYPKDQNDKWTRLRVFIESTGAGTKYRKQLTRQQVKDHPVQNFHRDLSSLRVFIELTGAGAIGKALAFFQIQNMGNNSRVNKSRIIWFKNMNSFLYIVVFCQHFVKNWRGEKSAVKVT